MKRQRLYPSGCCSAALLTLAGVLLLTTGCAVGPTASSRRDGADTTVFELRAIAAEGAVALLAELGWEEVFVLPESNSIAVGGSADVQQKAAVVLDLIDSPVPYAIERLAPVSQARGLPANEQFVAVLGNAAIGTFAEPPQRRRFGRAIIDIHDDSVIAVAPVPMCRDILTLLKFGPVALQRVEDHDKATTPTHQTIETAVAAETPEPATPATPKETPEETLSAAVVAEPFEPAVGEVEAETAMATESEPVEPALPEEPAVVAEAVVCDELSSDFVHLVACLGIEAILHVWASKGDSHASWPYGDVNDMCYQKTVAFDPVGPTHGYGEKKWNWHQWAEAEGRQYDPSAAASISGSWGDYEDHLFKEYHKCIQANPFQAQWVANQPGQSSGCEAPSHRVYSTVDPYDWRGR